MSRSRKSSNPGFDRFKEREHRGPVQRVAKPKPRRVMFVSDVHIGASDIKKPLPIATYVEFPSTDYWVQYLDMFVKGWVRMWVEDLHDPSVPGPEFANSPRVFSLSMYVKGRIADHMRDAYRRGPEQRAGENRMWSKFLKADGGALHSRIALVQDRMMKVINERTAPRRHSA